MALGQGASDETFAYYLRDKDEKNGSLQHSLESFHSLILWLGSDDSSSMDCHVCVLPLIEHHTLPQLVLITC
jgi:hypothetical protein